MHTHYSTAEALYEGWRKVGPDKKRVYVLTRSGFAGQQRFAASVWSGDINSDLADPVSGRCPPGSASRFRACRTGRRTSAATSATTSTGRTPQNNELFTRWFQFGAFCSLFRIHGGGARELYGNQWSATTKANLLLFDNLHYRLMPYLYSLAWKVTNEDYTIMRPLVFDFQSDTKVYDIKDQFMYGPAFLVNPVITAGATSRSVYLPAGTWYDFWTGATNEGGRSSTVNAPLSLIPLFVRAGSIVPMGPDDPIRDRKHRPAGDPDLQGRQRHLHALRGRRRHLQLRDRQVLAHQLSPGTTPPKS